MPLSVGHRGWSLTRTRREVFQTSSSRRSLAVTAYHTQSRPDHEHAWEPTRPREVLREYISIGDDTCRRVNMVHRGVLETLETSRVVPVVTKLTPELALSSHDWQKILLRYPQLFCSASMDRMDEVLDFLRTDLHMSQEQMRTVVVKFPQVFSFSVKGHLRPQLSYLQSLGVLPQDLAEVVCTRPLVLGEGIETVIKFLRLCRVPRKDMVSILRSYPIDYCIRFIVRDGPAFTAAPTDDDE